MYNKKNIVIYATIPLTFSAFLFTQFFCYSNDEIKTELLKKINTQIPTWMTNQINQDLAQVPKEGITLSVIDQAMDQESAYRVKFTIKDGYVSVDSGTYSPNSYTILFNLLKELSSYVKLPDVIFLYNADDAPFNYSNLVANNIPPKSLAKYPCPVFAQTKHIDDKNVILIPDQQTFWLMNSMLQEITLGRAKYPWYSKISKAFWRGATTGGFYFPENYTRFPRTKLVELSLKNPDLLDAKFHEVINYWGRGDLIKSLFESLGYLGKSISISEHMHYKYQILIDGHSASWTRCYWQLHANSVIFKQNSPYIQWYYGLLKPYVHYIPFDYFCSDLIDRIKWAHDNDAQVQEIIKNANDIAASSLTYTDMLLYLYAVITKYAQYQAFKP